MVFRVAGVVFHGQAEAFSQDVDEGVAFEVVGGWSEVYFAWLVGVAWFDDADGALGTGKGFRDF